MTPITIEAQVNAPVEKAWEYYNNPSHVVNWNFAVPEWHCPSAESDLRVGGKFSAHMAARDGSFAFDFGGEYTAVNAPHSLSYVLGDGRTATIRFEASGENTRVQVVFDPETENPIELQQAGWQAILNNYAAYTGSN